MIDFFQFLTLFLANAGLIVWFRSESKSDHRQAMDLIISIQNEMKDFHGRLERQDAEFRGRMEKQDAEFKGILAKQDAEFKSHMIYFHRDK